MSSQLLTHEIKNPLRAYADPHYVATAIEMYCGGSTLQQVADATGRSKQAVCVLLMRRGIAIRSVSEATRGWSQSALEQAIEMYVSGAAGPSEIRKKFDIPPTSLLRELHARGINVRRPGCPGLTGAAHPAWKGGHRLDKDGYVKTYAPSHPWPRRGGYVREHNRVMELHLGRRLLPTEVVHHLDSDVTHNDLENLELMTASEHSRLHRRLDAGQRLRGTDGTFR